jgi:hypothetical protein
VYERLGRDAVRKLDSPCKLADSARRTEFMHPTPEGILIGLAEQIG